MHCVQKLEALMLRYRLGTRNARKGFFVLLRRHHENQRVFTGMVLLFRHAKPSTVHYALKLCLQHVAECFECWKEIHRRMGFWKPLELKVLPPMEWHESADEELRRKFEAQAKSIEEVRQEMERLARSQWLYDRGEYAKLGGAEVAEACRYMNDRVQHFPGFPKSLAKYRPTVYVQ